MLPTQWPNWTLILIAFGLVALTILAGLVLEPLGQALAPAITPTPTLPSIHYARSLSDECIECHTEKQALAASVGPTENVEPFYVERASLNTPHGSLGCITCHGGTGNVTDKEAAHQGLIKDLSVTHPRDCLICHRNLPDQLPGDHLRTPHGKVVNAIWEGSACGVNCSDCHGQVGHGFDPVTGEITCQMSVCLDCHLERNLGAELITDCNTCHVGPHDVALVLTCNDCHTSTETWKDSTLRVHPVELTEQHATPNCFSCHRWPNFKGLDYVCSDCHQRPHDFGNDNCALCHTPEGWAESADDLVANATGIPHPLASREDCRSCHGMEGQPPIPVDHKGRTNDVCQFCHKLAPASAILHPVAGRGPCLDCHGEEQIAQFPLTTHGDRDETSCRTCHEPAGVTPLTVSHPMEEQADCLACHAFQALKPYPESHAGWKNQVCLLCHEAGAPLAQGEEHPFPQDHDGSAQNCVLCHPGGDFTTYHCDTCHVLTGIQPVHEARGIREIENKCLLCHPEGQKP